jgi:negative regulator of flagellin synthesis FlgM
MAHEITGLPRTPWLEIGGAKDGRNASASSTTPAQGTTGKVSLAGGAARLQQLEMALAPLPAADSQRVEYLKQAIAEGTYKPRAEHVVGKLFALERALARKS